MTEPTGEQARAKGRSSRHRAREVALQTLYALDIARRSTPEGEEAVPEDAAAVLDGVAAHFEAPAGAREFAWKLVAGVCEHRKTLDERIAQRAKNWRVSRMAAVDRNVLRLGTFELEHTETAVAVVLDEAVELARRYGGDTSPAFVNGILDALAKELRGSRA